jgi:8-oxo-dGTP diphosphatase
MKEYPIPVVRLIICNRHGKVLILKRGQTDYSPGMWSLPGGKVEYGETVKEAASKELSEETSLVCTSMRFLFYQDSLPLEPGGMHCINLYFECRVQGTIALNEESSQFAWIASDDLSNYEIAFRNDAALLRYWEEGGGCQIGTIS